MANTAGRIYSERQQKPLETEKPRHVTIALLEWLVVVPERRLLVLYIYLAECGVLVV